MLESITLTFLSQPGGIPVVALPTSIIPAKSPTCSSCSKQQMICSIRDGEERIKGGGEQEELKPLGEVCVGHMLLTEPGLLLC